MKKHFSTLNFVIFLCAFLYSETVLAQLGFCNGNSGDPIFTEDFGTGTNYGPALSAGTTNYEFVSVPGPQDGQYTVGPNTFALGWNLPSDHTPNDTNGKCLIVNADDDPTASGEFYSTPISGLCENTTYEFSAWLINILPNSGCGGAGIPVNVRFEIRNSTNTLLRGGATGNIFSSATPTWQQYGLVFKTDPGETSVILKMKNNGGVVSCGNDLAIDDIIFKTCGDNITINDQANNDNITICSSETPYSTTLTAMPDGSVFGIGSTLFYQWQESTDGITWTDIPTETSQNILLSGITTTSYFRSKVAESASNLNSSSCNVTSEVFQVTVNQPTTPTFIQVPDICNGDTLTALPTTSNEGITGTWSPALDNTSTTIYTFTPTPNIGQCAGFQTMTITVDQPITPTFTQVPDICSGDNFTLPATSIEGVTGTWMPALDSTSTTTYTFAPGPGECATSQNMTITVDQPTTPTFTQVPDICSGDSFTLPATSNEGITGTWSPALDNTSTATYTFAPGPGECATSQNMTITVDQPTIPTFTQVPDICNGDTLTALPTTSNEGITGTWSPALDNTSTTTYTFTPDPNIGQCAEIQTMPITVINAPVIETITSDGNAIVVNTSNTGDFLYSLDGIQYQSSNTLIIVENGLYTIYVKTSNCDDEVTMPYLHFYIPQFFTPNNDTVNDTFDLKGIENYSTSEVYIYDRFGKILKITKNTAFSWDGIYNNQPLPSSDYWYVIIIDGNRLAGHFTLKR